MTVSVRDGKKKNRQDVKDFAFYIFIILIRTSKCGHKAQLFLISTVNEA